jgi:glycerol uptake facilitator-like aquaporin/protein-tyrosine-phosphatase
MERSLSRRTVAEGLGTALLLAAIIGSGIMAERLSSGNLALALLANALATGGVLAAIILAFGPISGAHFNPAVTFANALMGRIKWREVPPYIGAQVGGAIAGVAAANVMFGEPILFASHHARNGYPILFGEFIATFGLLSVIFGCSRYGPRMTAFAVAAYIMGAYWFTSSTSFANPAVTIARSLSDTFAGIAPFDVPGFLCAEFLGTIAAVPVAKWLFSSKHLPEAAVMPRLPSVLFICIHNSARSQMAEAFLNRRCGHEYVAESAGLEQGTLNPLAVAAMREVGIDISHNRTKSVADLLDRANKYAYVITVCDEASAERCPVVPSGGRRLHWSIPDPSSLEGSWDERLTKTRLIREMIRARIEDWCTETCAAA